MSDLISRQAAVERFDCIRPCDPMTSDYTHGIDVGIALCKVAIREQPPAQHGTNLAEVGTDCISRADAIKIVQNRCKRLTTGCVLAVSEIKQLPPIQPEPAQWVPVTEEPIPDGEYLVTWTSEIQEKPILSIICRYSGVWDCWELQMLGHQDINVLAYMELPEPYKGVTT